MKKIILSISVLALLASCGSGDKKKDTPKSDTTKTDTTAVVDNTPKTKDFAYYLDKYQKITLDGIELKQSSLNKDSASKYINLIYDVTNSKDLGYEKVILDLSSTSTMSQEGKDQYANFSMENFLKGQNNGYEKKDMINTAMEYKSGETTFYYCTRKNIKGAMGSQDYNLMIIQTTNGEFILTGKISVSNLKSDMVNAEAGLKKVADYLAK